MMDLVEHARNELSLYGMTQARTEAFLRVIQAFADMGATPSYEPVAAQLVSDLLFRKAIAVITDDPAEWFLLPGSATPDGGGVWQNLRDKKVFSPDGGKHYYHLHNLGSVLDAASKRVMQTSASKAV